MISTWDYDDAFELRLEMVERQLRLRGIHQTAILQAFKDIPRHQFVPNTPLEEAYADHPSPIKAGQTISQPYIVALMIQYLELVKDHRILEIGSGCGYATAILAQLGKHIDALEVYDVLVQDARNVLELLSIHNVTLHHRSAWEQFDGDVGYDRIILWASPPRIPEHLFDKLSDGGILVAPEGKGKQHVWIYKKNAERLKRIKKDAVRFVPLVQGTKEEIDRPLKGLL
ncbi:MAG: protein-L-isoaspartate(D-aspartate) O-methyltransferase [Candidatus Marinimicrobia bacterium]|nr:protein-L-isoaspartate(D-aspartate) O-methyltransferase [Candidatus Neomarinimicrobiota bacterium]